MHNALIDLVEFPADNWASGWSKQSPGLEYVPCSSLDPCKMLAPSKVHMLDHVFCGKFAHIDVLLKQILEKIPVSDD